MNREEESLVKRIIKGTEQGQINWRNGGKDKFTTEVDGMTLTLYRSTWPIYFYLDIQNGNGKTSLLDDSSPFPYPFCKGPIEKFWELMDRKQGRTFNHSRLISKLTTLV